MTHRLRSALERALGSSVLGIVRVGGGSINEAYDVHLADGRRVFAKTHTNPPDRFFSVEAAALGWLGEVHAVHVPAVLAHDDGERDEPAFLALDWIEPSHATIHAHETLGTSLAELHRSGAPGWGWDRPGYIGDLPQDNEPADTWPSFYAERRLLPCARRAVDAGALPSGFLHRLDRLVERLPELAGPPEPPARLHGDLWGGNLLVDTDGTPWLIDPAPYGGDREVDLAMMRLFGGFGAQVFDAYEAAWPLPVGHDERVGLYQLYPILVHVVLFGGGYAGQANALLRRYE